MAYFKNFSSFANYDLSKAIKLFFDGPFKQWVDYLTPEERQEFNLNLLAPLLEFLEQKYDNRKIEIHIREDFKEEIIQNDLQIPSKTVFFIPHNLVKAHPEYFTYVSE